MSQPPDPCRGGNPARAVDGDPTGRYLLVLAGGIRENRRAETEHAVK